MSNALYDKGRQKILEGGIAILTDTIKAALVSTAYTVDLAAHEFLSDLGANRIGTDQTLGTPSSTAGVFDAADSLWTAVAGGSTVGAVVIYKDTTVAGTSPLIAYIDTGGGLPYSTGGGNIPVVWASTAAKIFKL